MRKLLSSLIGVGALCAFSVGSALADTPLRAAPQSVTSVYNWTGVYAGAHLGYAKGREEWDGGPRFAFDVDGWLGGLQAGFNQQVGNWVFGIEGDISWSKINGRQTVRFGGPVFGFEEGSIPSTDIDRIATLAGRLGFAQDRWLVYMKAGAAWVHENHAFTLSTTAPGGGQPITRTSAESRFSTMLGIGSEFALWGNWSFKSEYNFISLPSARTILRGTSPFPVTTDTGQALHIAKFGINYRFGPDTPPPIEPSRPAPGYDWTGAWVGVQAGYGFGRKEWPDFIPPLDRFNVDGWLAGVTTGVNAQAGVFVIGVETEWLWSRIDGGATATATLGGLSQTNNETSRVDWLSLNSVRVGFAGADRWLLYVKGGVALAKETHTQSTVQSLVGVGSTTTNVSGSALHTGYLAGIGVEHAFLGNWSAKLEYNYINVRFQDLVLTGVSNFNSPPFLVGSIGTSRHFVIRQDLHLVKIGINYHFTGFMDAISPR